MRNSVHTLAYRLTQVRQQLGFVSPLSPRELEEVAGYLSDPALRLFVCLSTADQRHSLRVCRGLQARGWTDPAMLTAALLHDVGKAAGHVPFWTRPVIVLVGHCSPRLLTRLTAYPIESRPLSRWRRALSYAWWHAEIGADLAAEAGVDRLVVHYIRMHHRPDSPELAELHLVDEAS